MKDWSDVHTKGQLRKRYFEYLPSLQKISMNYGYALAVHGSVERDLDLVAVPWVKNALAPETLVMALQEAMTGYSYTRAHWKKDARHGEKPHGRKAYTLLIAALADDFDGMSLGHQQRHAWIDLSVMPRYGYF